MFKRLPLVKAGGKVYPSVNTDTLNGFLGLDNSLVQQLGGPLSSPILWEGGSLELVGHRSDVRSLAFSSNNTALASRSAEPVKVWFRSSLQPVRSLTSGYVLALMFCPCNRHLLYASNAEMFNLGSEELTESI